MFRLWSLKKPKIPKGFSYVAGVSLLSEKFAEIPQESTIDIWYSISPMDHLTMHEITKRKLPYKILSAWYFVFGRSGEWHFMVYPVPSPKKHEVQSMLKEKIFPLMYRWLCEERTETWLTPSHSLDVIFDQKAGDLVLKER